MRSFCHLPGHRERGHLLVGTGMAAMTIILALAGVMGAISAQAAPPTEAYIVSPATTTFVAPGQQLEVTVGYTSLPSFSGSTSAAVQIGTGAVAGEGSTAGLADGQRLEAVVPVDVDAAASDGQYDLHATVTNSDDAMGLTATAPGVVIVDGTPPAADITQPVSGEVVKGTVFLSGTASDMNLRRWRLQLDGIVGISSGTGPVTDGSLGVLSTASFSDGVHTLDLTVEDKAGNVASASITIHIDNSPPSLALSSPQDGSLVGGTITVTGTASDQHMAGWTMGLPDDGGAQVNSGTNSIVDGSLGQWDSTSLTDGGHRLQLTASDTAGNIAALEITVETDNTEPAVSLDMPPAGHFVSGQSVDIFGAVSDVHLTAWELTIDGVGSVTNGTNAASGVLATSDVSGLADGVHTVTLTATDRAGNTAATAGTLTVDRNAPAVGVTEPRSTTSVGSHFSIIGTVADPYLASWQVMADGTHLLAEGTTEIVGGELATVDATGWSPGSHWLQIKATDQAGNVSGVSVAVTLDNQGPVVDFQSPTANDLIYGSLQIIGRVEDDYLSSWTLLLDGSEVGSGTVPVVDAGLSTVDTTTLPDGDHTLRLEAVDQAGNGTVSELTFQTDNTAPVVNIISPADGLVVDGTGPTVDVSGTIDDAHLDSWQLTAEPGSVVVAAGQAAVNAGIIATWSTAGQADQGYTLVLTATDALGQTSATQVSVTVDSASPVAEITDPTVDGVVGGMQTVRGTAWDLSMDRWIISVGGVDQLTGNVNVEGDFGSIDTTLLTDGNHNLKLKIWDMTNRNSSQQVSFVVDNTSPLVSLSAPGSGSLVSGDVAVVGSVDDLHLVGWTLEAVDAGGVGQELAADVTPLANQQVVSLATGTLVDGTWLLRLSASDAAGNTATTEVPLDVDNTPPSLAITSPRGQGVMGGAAASIAGSVSDAHDVNWTLSLASGTTIASDSGTVDGVLGVVDTTTLPEGPDELVLSTVDAAGNNRETRQPVIIDNTAPTAAFRAPVPDSVVTGVVEIAAEITDINPAEWSLGVVGGATLDAGTGSVAGTLTQVDMGSLPDGPITLELDVSDLAGNTAHVELPLVVDNTAPTVDIMFPSSGSVLSGAVSVFGTVSDTNLELWQVSLNGTTITSGTQPKSSELVAGFDSRAFTDGAYTLGFHAVDLAGNTSEVHVDVVIDNGSPTVKLNRPYANEYVKGTMDIKATIQDPTLAAWTMTVVEIGQTLASGQNERSYDTVATVDTTTWTDGTYTLDLTAVDQFGAATSTSVTFRVDNTVPQVDLGSPVDGAVARDTVTVTGTVDDTNLSSWRLVLNGSVVALGYRSVTNQDLKVLDVSNYADGVYELVLSARDRIGNQASVTRNFFIDTAPPSLTGPQPGDGAMTSDPTPQISIQVSGATASEMWIDGVQVGAVLTGGTVSFTPVSNLADGSHTVTVKVVDSQANEATSTWSFTVDATPPGVSNLFPDDGSTVSISHGTVSAVISGYDAISLMVDGVSIDSSVYSVFNGKLVYAPPQPFAAGTHTVQMTLTDTVGNVTTVQSDFTVESRREGFGFGRLWF